MAIFTKISERKNFFKALDKKIGLAEKNNTIVNLIIIKLIRLREINEEYGYEFADELLDTIYTRIANLLKGKDEISRIGDKEFAIILCDGHGIGDGILFSNQLLALFDEPVTIKDKSFKVKIKLGMASYPEHAIHAITLMQCADNAINIAVDSEQNYIVYEEVSNSDTTTMFALESELEKAITNHGIEYYYQPKVNLSNNKVTGFEVLARWHSSKHGQIRPDIFIDVAEKSDLITRLTIDCLSSCLQSHSELNEKYKIDFLLSVNLSAKILNNPENTEQIINTINIWCKNTEHLVLEITEGAIMKDPEFARNTLMKFHELGIKTSIDDFGTGYSSLSYLQTLPVDELKIDKSFVLNLLENDDDILITQSVIDLAHNFNLLAVAEGVESEAAMHKLNEMKCDIAQGYFISKPLPLEELIPWLDQWQAGH